MTRDRFILIILLALVFLWPQSLQALSCNYSKCDFSGGGTPWCDDNAGFVDCGACAGASYCDYSSQESCGGSGCQYPGINANPCGCTYGYQYQYEYEYQYEYQYQTPYTYQYQYQTPYGYQYQYQYQYQTPNSAPTASSVRLTEPDYCTTGPGGVVAWNYSDPDGDAQSAYRVQVDDAASFATPVLDSNKISSANKSYSLGVGLLFGSSYWSRVMAWDALNNASAWAGQTLCTGPGCAGNQLSWTTPVHAYPNNINFTFLPASPRANLPVQFSTAGVTCYNNANNPIACTVFSWNFGDGNLISGNFPSPSHTYLATGVYQVKLSVSDGLYTCPTAGPLTKPVSVQAGIPSWKEVLPFF